MSDRNRCEELPRPERNVLYLIFHGELAFFDSPGSDRIRVFAPPVPTHTYTAGSWLAERRIPQGTTMQLIGVCSGDKSIRDDPNFVLLNQNSEARPAGAHFEVRLPRPDEILDGFVIGIDEGAIKINKKPIPNRQMDLRPIFKYTMKRDKAYLSDLDHDADDSPDDPNWGAREGCPGYYSLHIFAEEDSVLTDIDNHAEAAFSQAGHVLGVNNVEADDSKNKGPKKASDIPGLDPSEFLLTLAARTKILADIGAQLRRGHGDCLHWDSSFETEDPRIRDSHASCGPVGN